MERFLCEEESITEIMAMEAESILAAQQAQYKSTEVEKEVELQFDVGNLLATDLNNLDEDELK